MLYPQDLLSTRALVRPGLFSLIPRDALCPSAMPGIENCVVNVLASPKVGASFVEYHVVAQPGGGTTMPFCMQEGVELFFYVIEGRAHVKSEGHNVRLETGGYLFVPPGKGLEFSNTGGDDARYLVYKQRYVPLGDRLPAFVDGNINTAPVKQETEDSSVSLLLPMDDMAYDMSYNVLRFAPGGCHAFVEAHVQEHGLYVLSGEGMYYIDDRWAPVRKDDFIWFGPFCPQVTYSVGRENFSYIFSKDANRDPQI